MRLDQRAIRLRELDADAPTAAIEIELFNPPVTLAPNMLEFTVTPPEFVMVIFASAIL